MNAFGFGIGHQSFLMNASSLFNKVEMNFKEGKRSTEWVKRLPEVVLALNSKETRLTGNKPVDAIREKVVDNN